MRIEPYRRLNNYQSDRRRKYRLMKYERHEDEN